MRASLIGPLPEPGSWSEMKAHLLSLHLLSHNRRSYGGSGCSLPFSSGFCDARGPHRTLNLGDALMGKAKQMRNANDDKSPLIDLLTCIVCKVTMKIANSTPDAEGSDLVQYRCKLCNRTELVRLFRRSRDAAA